VFHSNETSAPIANLPSGAQLGGTPTIPPKLHLGPCSSEGMWRGTYTDRQTDTHTHTDACDWYTFRVVYDSSEM